LKNLLNKALSAATVTVLLYSCKPNIDKPAAGKGSLDLSKYIALGTTMSAGYADNALYHKAQLAAYPNLIAQQFKLAGGADFKQPLVNVNSPGVGSPLHLNARLVLAPLSDCSGTVSLLPVEASAEGDLSIFTNSVAAQGPFQNLSVPGLKATTLIYPGYGNPSNPMGFNPFFTRMTTDPQHASVLGEAAVQQPSFFSLAIGNEDVLSYAVSGGAADQVTPASGAPGVGFDGSVDLIVNTLTAHGAKGVIANVPHISALPFFTTIPYNGLALDQASAAGLTAAYTPFGISFHEGYNPFIIEDANAPGGRRQIHQGEYVLLTTPGDSIKCKGWGSLKPIPHQYILTSDEVLQLSDAVNAYNNKIKAIADEKGLAFVDVNAFLLTVKTGIVYNGLQVNTSYVAGGSFSLDGLHFTPLGNALMANEFIKAINFKYGSSIPQVNAGNYKGVSFP
jgi:hypothetical protein